MVVGAFSSIGPLFAIAGGFIADKFLGAYRSLTIAYFGFTCGYVLLVIGASTVNIPLSLAGIALASYGRGLMSPSYPSLYKRTFKSQEDFENGYPVNYSVNNIGALLGQYLFPMFVLVIGFYGSFMLSGILAFAALFTLMTFRKQLQASVQISTKHLSLTQTGLNSVLLLSPWLEWCSLCSLIWTSARTLFTPLVWRQSAILFL